MKQKAASLKRPTKLTFVEGWKITLHLNFPINIHVNLWNVWMILYIGKVWLHWGSREKELKLNYPRCYQNAIMSILIRERHRKIWQINRRTERGGNMSSDVTRNAKDCCSHLDLGERHKTGSFLEIPEGVWPYTHLDFRLWEWISAI